MYLVLFHNFGKHYEHKFLFWAQNFGLNIYLKNSITFKTEKINNIPINLKYFRI